MKQHCMQVPTLDTDRLILEPLDLRHSEGMFRMWSSPEVCKYSGPASDLSGEPIQLPAASPADSDKIVEFFLSRCEGGDGFRWALISRSTGGFLGAAGFNSLGECCELAYHMDPGAWGSGFMYEACRAAMDWARGEYGARAVVAFVEHNNARSIRLARRLGMAPSGSGEGGTQKYATDESWLAG
jgi:RimJ/RimL family protein N-acetyltransferase